MSQYYFPVKSRDRTFLDDHGEEFSSLDAARGHAESMARDLMRNREKKTRAWRIQVLDSSHEKCCEIVFVSVDDSIAHFRADIRGSIRRSACRVAALSEVIMEARHRVRQAQATLARAARKPHLAAADGRRI